MELKVKSVSKERGSELHLALAPLKRIDKQGRPYNEKAISGIFHNNEDWNNNKRHSSNSLIER